MHALDMAGKEVVFQGEPWTHPVAPCSKQAIPLLEQNERVVSWISPIGGRVGDHVPAIMFKGKFYTLSLRMQKAIYRHIRLKKGFSNEEVMDGVTKLRIPDVLLKEKIRTQFRFDAMRRRDCKDVGGAAKADDAAADAGAVQQQPPPPPPQAAQDRGRDRSKSSCTVSARLKQVVDQLLACNEEQYAAALQQVTIFVFKSQQSELVSNFLEEMRRENAALFRDRSALLAMVADSYDAMASGGAGAATAGSGEGGCVRG